MPGVSSPLQGQLSVESRDELDVWHAWQSNKILVTKRNLKRQFVRHTRVDKNRQILGISKILPGILVNISEGYEDCNSIFVIRYFYKS
jgi:hypothetical protein